MDTDFINKLRDALSDFSARDMALAGQQISIMPHRTNDGSDEEEDWCFKVQSYDTDGIIIDTKLL